MLEKIKSNKPLIIAVSVVIIVGIFMYIMNNRDGSGSLTIKTGENEVTMEFSDNKVNFRDLIEILFNNDKYKKDALAILRDSYDLYYKDSELLVDSIRRESGESKFSQQIRGLLVDLKGPFERKYHNYYDITDVRVVDAISTLGYKHDVAKKLREIKDSAKGIFEQRGIDVDVAFISSDNILNGNAAVCEDSQHRGRDLLLLNPNNLTKTITVFARNRFPCVRKSDGSGWEKPLIQVNLNDGKQLFGNIILGKKENAILYPAPKGYSINPKVAQTSESQQNNLVQR